MMLAEKMTGAGSQLTLGQPEWHEIYAIRQQGSAAVNKFASRSLFDEMGLHEVRHPLWRLLAELSLKFDLQNSIP